MQAMLEYQKQKRDAITVIVVVISNNPKAGGIEIAEKLGTPVEVVGLPEIEDKLERRLNHESSIDTILRKFDVELIILSGYMRLLSAEFVNKWRCK